MQFLLRECDLANRKFFHQPINHETGYELPNAGYVKGKFENCTCEICKEKQKRDEKTD